MESLAHQLQTEAKQKAQNAYQQQKRELENAATADMERIQARLEVESRKLADIEAKQLAYIEAQKRAKEIEEQRDYYRLAIDETDLQDIALLRDLQLRFIKKDAIDKLIWEVYYKPAYDVLMSHVFLSSNKICGIYKLTDLISGQIYIGQSVDCKERARQHIKSALTYGKATNKLYQMMQKSGIHNFTFELLEEVPRNQLNEREAYWIKFYQTNLVGLNTQSGKTTGQS